MTKLSEQEQVAIRGGSSATALLHDLVIDSMQRYPDTFAHLTPPDERRFRRGYPDFLASFEAARLAGPDVSAIAMGLVEGLKQRIVWGADEQPLSEALASAVAPLPLQSTTLPGTAGWRAQVSLADRDWQLATADDLGQQLSQANLVSEWVADAFAWLTTSAGATRQADGTMRLDLSGRKIAMLGAGAEMAPTKHWLEAGAQVLWLDTNPPPPDWQHANLAGRLWWSSTPVDLLRQPGAVLATLLEFADGSPLDLGLYAYAPGQAREVRLTCAMNALVDALPHDLISSVTMLISPTTPTALSAAGRQRMADRLAQRPAWEAVCDALGLVGRGGGAALSESAATTRTVVGIQGASYQAAQYIGKLLTAQCWAAQGLRVSANTAAITRTRSLAHPVFAAAFGGARAMGVQTMSPAQSQCLNGLLAVHDWLQPELPAPGRGGVHGGLHYLPYPLQSALRVAAAIGFARRPALLGGLLSRG